MSKIKETMGTALALNEAETKYLLAAAQQESSFERLLKFKKGVYEASGETVPIGIKRTLDRGERRWRSTSGRA